MTNDMIQLLVNTDQNLLLYLNGFHNAFGDYFMSTFTGKWIWDSYATSSPMCL